MRTGCLWLLFCLFPDAILREIHMKKLWKDYCGSDASRENNWIGFDEGNSG